MSMKVKQRRNKLKQRAFGFRARDSVQDPGKDICKHRIQQTWCGGGEAI